MKSPYSSVGNSAEAWCEINRFWNTALKSLYYFTMIKLKMSIVWDLPNWQVYLNIWQVYRKSQLDKLTSKFAKLAIDSWEWEMLRLR